MQGIRSIVENMKNRLAYGILAHHQVYIDIPFILPGLTHNGTALYGDSTLRNNTPRFALDAILIRPYLLIKAFVAICAKAGFFSKR
jgi:hypothetical protein